MHWFTDIRWPLISMELENVKQIRVVEPSYKVLTAPQLMHSSLKNCHSSSITDETNQSPHNFIWTSPVFWQWFVAFAYAWHFFKVGSLTTYFNILLYVKNKRIILVFFSLGNLKPAMSMAYIGSRAKWLERGLLLKLLNIFGCWAFKNRYILLLKVN